MGRRQKFYRCICQNCGKTIIAKYPRVYCDECYKYGRAMHVADMLLAQPSEVHVDAIPVTEIERLAKQEGCQIQSVRAVLRKRGYKAMTVYVKEGQV
jgi:hypothetical protein